MLPDHPAREATVSCAVEFLASEAKEAFVDAIGARHLYSSRSTGHL